MNMQYRHSIARFWLLLGLLALLLPLIAACGAQDTAPASTGATGAQRATKPGPDTRAEQIVPVEGQAFSGQDRATRPNTPMFLAFDALG